jgi:hypothetical protein
MMYADISGVSSESRFIFKINGAFAGPVGSPVRRFISIPRPDVVSLAYLCSHRSSPLAMLRLHEEPFETLHRPFVAIARRMRSNMIVPVPAERRPDLQEGDH